MRAHGIDNENPTDRKQQAGRKKDQQGRPSSGRLGNSLHRSVKGDKEMKDRFSFQLRQ